MSARALMCYRANGDAVVCAWCEDAAVAEAEAAAAGYQVTHGICHACKAKELGDVTAQSFPEGFVGVDVIASVCGLPAEALSECHRPRRWRPGNEFIAARTVGVAFRLAFLGELVAQLSVTGQPEAAGRLLRWLTRETQRAGGSEHPQPVAAPSPRRSWINNWEEAHGQ